MDYFLEMCCAWKRLKKKALSSKKLAISGIVTPGFIIYYLYNLLLPKGGGGENGEGEET